MSDIASIQEITLRKLDRATRLVAEAERRLEAAKQAEASARRERELLERDRAIIDRYFTQTIDVLTEKIRRVHDSVLARLEVLLRRMSGPHHFDDGDLAMEFRFLTDELEEWRSLLLPPP